jgi:GNAT superfamily N-acetyltransferase
MVSPSQTHIRPAQPNDVPGIHALLLELADYERLSHTVKATEDALHEALFGSKPAAEAIVAEVDGRMVGYALYFTTYSTFVGRPGIYLEDLFVQPASRGQGIGKQLLARVAATAIERNCGRLEWAVLDWNQPSIEFYKRLGASTMDDWTVYRMTGESLAALGRRAMSS